MRWLLRERRAMTEEKERTVEIRLKGDDVRAKLKELVREGNIRRLSLRNDHGKVLFEIPLTIGVVGALLRPHLVAIVAMVALVKDRTIVVEKVEDMGLQAPWARQSLVSMGWLLVGRPSSLPRLGST